MLDTLGLLDALDSLNDTLDWTQLYTHESNLNSTSSHKKVNLSLVLSQLKGDKTLEALNFTDDFLESALWPSLQAHNWREQAEKLLTQPEYIVMLLLCVFSIVTNVMSIVAISHVQHGRTMHLKLIINLAVSDLLIVFSVLTHIINKMFNSPRAVGLSDPSDRLMNACIFATVSSINIMSFLISLLNLLAMAVDHYIAIMKPLSYSYMMSKKNGYILIAVLWISAAVGGFSNFLFGFGGFSAKKELFNYCEYVMFDGYHAEFLVLGVTLICLVAITYIYTRIYFVVRRIQSRNIMFPDHNLHNKKAMITTLLIIGTFTFCWLPNCIFQITMIIQIHFNDAIVLKLFNTFQLVSKYLYILQLTNCLFDPIIYAVRLKIVKNGYKNFLERVKKHYAHTKSCIVENDSLVTHPPSSRRTTITPLALQELSSLLMHNNPDLAHFDSNGSSFYKKSDESDYNENECIMVTLHTYKDMNPTDVDDIAETAV